MIFNDTTLDPSTLDLSRLRAAIRDHEAAIRELKAPLRRRWEAPMAATQRRLLRHQREVTLCLVLRAGLRGRAHLRVTPEETRRAALRLAERFVRTLEEEVALAVG